MAIEKIDIPRFLDLYSTIPVFDVRSPGEYIHAHIPCSYSLPLFDDEERKKVGTAYKQESREQAIKIGLDFFGVKMRRIVEEVSTLLATKAFKNVAAIDSTNFAGKPEVIVHCWRGGMRSAAIAWLLDLYGFKVYTLIGGYKSFRKWVLDRLEQDHNLTVLGGYTGSGKTEILHHLGSKGEIIVDLEGIANHKGSAFGAIGMPAQPSPEMFENQLAIDLHTASAAGKRIWIEDESQRIGLINVPRNFWQLMRTKPVCFIDIPFDHRLTFICSTYGRLDKENLAAAITRIQKRLGPLETKTALTFLEQDDIRQCFQILLTYYDRLYNKALANRPETNKQIHRISCSHPGGVEAAIQIIESTKPKYA